MNSFYIRFNTEELQELKILKEVVKPERFFVSLQADSLDEVEILIKDSIIGNNYSTIINIIPEIQNGFSIWPFEYFINQVKKHHDIIYILDNIRSEPCGKCECGVYNEIALLNKKSREFGVLSKMDRILNIPKCKKEDSKYCCGYYDYHTMITSIDDFQDNKNN
jgi:hypothetical protein